MRHLQEMPVVISVVNITQQQHHCSDNATPPPTQRVALDPVYEQLDACLVFLPQLHAVRCCFADELCEDASLRCCADSAPLAAAFATPAWQAICNNAPVVQTIRLDAPAQNVILLLGQPHHTCQQQATEAALLLCLTASELLAGAALRLNATAHVTTTSQAQLAG
jgi:hypothetical protein